MDSKTILEIRPLLRSFFPVAWLGHLGLGLTYGLMGPAQPYLARYTTKYLICRYTYCGYLCMILIKSILR